MNDISPTLNCKNIVKQRKLKGLPVYNFGLGENPLPINEPKKSNPALMNEVIESLTVKETPDTTEVGVETITDKG